MADQLVHALEALHRVRMLGDIVVRGALVRDGPELHDLRMGAYA